MAVRWTPWELGEIRKERPELTLKPVPPIDWVVVQFLKEHDVDARPVSFGDRSAGEMAMSGLMGAMGTFEIAAYQGLKGQEKAVKAQEWTSWKQWALSHDDWAAFKESHMGEPRRHNDEVERQLSDPAFVEEWSARFKRNPAESATALADRETIQLLVWVVSIAMGLFIVGNLVISFIDAPSPQSVPEKRK